MKLPFLFFPRMLAIEREIGRSRQFSWAASVCQHFLHAGSRGEEGLYQFSSLPASGAAPVWNLFAVTWIARQSPPEVAMASNLASETEKAC